MKNIFVFALFVSLVCTSFTGIQGVEAAVPMDTLIKGSTSALYYHGQDGNRYAFPNQSIYLSWFKDFSFIETVSDEILATIPLKGVVLYRPGIRLVKITTDPKTYAVDKQGVLRWVVSEQVAIDLYGTNWSKNVDDLPDAFFSNYTIGEPIESGADFIPQTIASETTIINTLLQINQGSTPLQSTTQPGIRTYSGADLAPDLIPFAPYDIRYRDEDGRILLKFTSTFWNGGNGDLMLLAREPEVSDTSHSHSHDEGVVDDSHYDTFQLLDQAGGTQRVHYVGELFFHTSHSHYHYDNFGDYNLYPARGINANKSEPMVTHKTTFCMRDDLRVDLSLPGASNRADYQNCGLTGQGVSVGWADVYPWTLPDQFVDVTDILPGTYTLTFEVDPLGRFIETNTANNKSFAILDINPQARGVTLIASGAAYAGGRSTFPDGMLVREQSSSDYYLITQNTKRKVMNNEVRQSYGYEVTDAFIVPDGVLEYVPTTQFVRFVENSTVYMLNDAGYIRKILSPTVLGSYADNGVIANINAQEFQSYQTTNLVLRPGTEDVYAIDSRKFVGALDELAVLGKNIFSVQRINQADFANYAVDIISTGHEIPWDIAFLPNGDLLLTERTGVFRRTGSQRAEVQIEDVIHSGEGGLMGIAVHPDFEQNQFIYLYYTSDLNGGTNRVERFRLNGALLQKDKVIIENIPSSIYHDGGQLEFGPDGYLYVVTGDASQPNLAQDINSLAGKTLRLYDDGRIPEDNPFGTAIWSYGHRNAQGITWDAQGRMWQTEHGRSGASSGHDELNLVEKGKNYGWPTIQGPETAPGMIAPVLESGATTTWAPSGMAYLDGSIYFAGLRGERLYKATITSDAKVSAFTEHFIEQYGRIRAVTVGPDGNLYISTSNQDGRAEAREGDDKVIKIYPDFL